MINKNDKEDLLLVYNYVSFSTFKKIVENKSLLLNNVRTSNDSTELQLQYGVILKAIESEYIRKYKKVKYLENIKVDNFMDLVKKKTEHIVLSQKYLHTQYALCFSNDGDLLSQWRGYGQSYYLNKELSLDNNKVGKQIKEQDMNICSGISIGFDRDELSKITEKLGINFQRVRYTDKQHLSFIKEDVKEMMLDIFKYIKANGTIDECCWTKFCVKYENIITNKGPFIKNAFFKEEKEWRVSKWGTIQKNKYTINIDKTINKLIKDIIVGPLSDVSVEKVNSVLEKNGIKARARYSKGKDVFIKPINHNIKAE